MTTSVTSCCCQSRGSFSFILATVLKLMKGLLLSSVKIILVSLQGLIISKMFQMFVRLFVDENLDRMVPISKQPKEKIQAIIDACARQFPEFADRTRKRIRTYLKSCRRHKRTRDSNGWETVSSSVRKYYVE